MLDIFYYSTISHVIFGLSGVILYLTLTGAEVERPTSDQKIVSPDVPAHVSTCQDTESHNEPA